MSSSITRSVPFPPRPTSSIVPPPSPPPDVDEPPVETTTTTIARRTTTTTATTTTPIATTTTTTTSTTLSITTLSTTTTSITIRPQAPTETGSPTSGDGTQTLGGSADSLTESSSSVLPMILMVGGGAIALLACVAFAIYMYRSRSRRNRPGGGPRKVKLPGKPVLRPTPMDPNAPTVIRPGSFLAPLDSTLPNGIDPLPPVPPVPANLIRPPSFHPPPPPNSQPPSLPGRVIPIAALPALGAMDPRAMSPRMSLTSSTPVSGTDLAYEDSLQSLVDAWHSVASHLDAYVRRESNVLSSLDRTTGNAAMDLAIVNRVRTQRAERLAALATQVVQQLETGLAVGDLRTFTLEATDVLQRVARVYPDMQLFVPRAGMFVVASEVEVYHHDDPYGGEEAEQGHGIVRATVFPGWREARSGRIIVRARVLTEVMG